MKHHAFFSPEHAVARAIASRRADDAEVPRVRFSHPSTRTHKPTVMQVLLGIGPLLLALVVIPLNTARRRRLRAARRRS